MKLLNREELHRAQTEELPWGHVATLCAPPRNRWGLRTNPAPAQNQSSKDATQDINKHFLMWWMFMSSTLQTSAFMGKNCSEILHYMKRTWKDSHNETDAQHIWKIDSRTIRWDLWSVSHQPGKCFMKNILSLTGDEEVISLSQVEVQVFSDSVLRFTQNQILSGKTSWRGSRVRHNTEPWTNWCWTNGIRVEYFPKIHHIAALQQSPRAHDQSVLETMNGNAVLTAHSCLHLKTDSHQENGHSSDLDQKRSGIKIVNTLLTRLKKKTERISNVTEDGEKHSMIWWMSCLWQWNQQYSW